MYPLHCLSSQESLICLSALHAGVIGAGQEKTVDFEIANVKSRVKLLATIRNRVVSNEKIFE